MNNRKHFLFAAFSLLLAGLLLSTIRPPAAQAQTSALSAERQLAREIFQELIEINTTDSVGNTTQAAEAMATRLKAAGFAASDVQVLGPHPRKGNLIARLRGSGARRP